MKGSLIISKHLNNTICLLLFACTSNPTGITSVRVLAGSMRVVVFQKAALWRSNIKSMLAALMP